MWYQSPSTASDFLLSCNPSASLTLITVLHPLQQGYIHPSSTSTSLTATKNRCYVLPILTAPHHNHSTVTIRLIDAADVGLIFTVNYGVEHITIYYEYHPPNFLSTDTVVFSQGNLFRATVPSYVTDASNTRSNNKSCPQRIMHKSCVHPLHRHKHINGRSKTSWKRVYLSMNTSGSTVFRIQDLLRHPRQRSQVQRARRVIVSQRSQNISRSIWDCILSYMHWRWRWSK